MALSRTASPTATVTAYNVYRPIVNGGRVQFADLNYTGLVLQAGVAYYYGADSVDRKRK